MFESTEKAESSQGMRDFYKNKTILITGTTGFVGSVLLETLLRCFPEIKSIYMLLRKKKNVEPDARKEQILEKKVFDKLKKKTPEFLEKVHVISGDVSLPNLGMSQEDVQLLIEEVSIVFHCAAIVNFMKPLEYTLTNNVLGLDSVIELCRQMKKLEVLVYTSTAMSNCNHLNFLMKEEVYRLPFHAEKFLDALKKKDNERLYELAGHCKPDFPNTYTFSKCLAENVIMDTASDLPVVIVRPSIVYGTWKNPMPGYAEENSGIAALSLGTGKGFVKVINGDPKAILDLVPADVVANAHVIAAWAIAAHRCASPFVVNCTASDNFQVPLKEFNDTVSTVGKKYPLPKSFAQFNDVILVTNKYLFNIVAAYHHHLPAVVLDGILKMLGKKPRVYSLYRFLDKVMSSLNFFMFNSFKFERKNLEFLNELVKSEGIEDLSLNFDDATLLETSFDIPRASLFYDWKIDTKSESERQKIIYRRYLMIVGIQWTFLIICCLFLYWVISFIFW